MASGMRRNNRRQYAKNTNDHVLFALVILVAAAIYAHQVKHLMREQTIVEFACIATALVLLVFLIKFLRKLTRRKPVHHLPRSLLDAMTGIEFERYVAKVLPSQGYSRIQLTEHYDLGVDIIAEKEGILWGIQVKRYSGPVKMAAVQQVVAALKHYDCSRAMVITNSSFSSSAQDLAASNNCALIDGQQLLHWTNP